MCREETGGTVTTQKPIHSSLHMKLNTHTYIRVVKHKNQQSGTSLVVQQLRVCLPMQGTWVQSLVLENHTCCGAAKPVCPNYRNLGTLEPMFCNKRSYRNEKLMHNN